MTETKFEGSSTVAAKLRELASQIEAGTFTPVEYTIKAVDRDRPNNFDLPEEPLGMGGRLPYQRKPESRLDWTITLFGLMDKPRV